MLEITKLAIVSDCTPEYIVQIVSAALNVKHLITGRLFHEKLLFPKGNLNF